MMLEDIAAAFSAPDFAVRNGFLLGGNGLIRPHDDGVKVTLPAARAHGLNGRVLSISEGGVQVWFDWPMRPDEIGKFAKAVGIGQLPETALY